MNNQTTFQVGDIVTCIRRRQTLIYRVKEIVMETWTQQQCNWQQCSQADVGTQYPRALKLNSVFDLVMKVPSKQRKTNFTAYLSQCTKVEPQHLIDLIQRMDKFVSETWP
jgi:hypothetical protein